MMLFLLLNVLFVIAIRSEETSIGMLHFENIFMYTSS